MPSDHVCNNGITVAFVLKYPKIKYLKKYRFDTDASALTKDLEWFLRS